MAPLTMMECGDCGHVQLQHVVDGEALYRDYSFQTSSSQRMSDHFAELLAENITRSVRTNGFVVEIGSNDGTALASIQRSDVRRLGIDPAENLAVIAAQRGVPVLTEFFNHATALRVLKSNGPADLIVACNVLAHIDDLDDVFRGVAVLLRPDGRLIVEVPDIECLLRRTEFDTIYHEHLNYFSFHSLSTLLARHAMVIDRIQYYEVHGGTKRLTIRRSGHFRNHSVMRSHHDWDGFRHRSQTLRTNLIHWLTDQRDLGHTVWGYGAPAKGTVLLNYCDITTDLLPVIVDSTPMKQGHFMPGTHQPIVGPDEFRLARPDFALVLAWNHFSEISAKESAYRAQGGQLVRPDLSDLPGKPV